MSDNHDNKVVIKFEIQVPMAGGQAPVVINSAASAPAPAPSPLSAPAPALAPIRLSGVFTPMRVKVSGSETTGVVCVRATGDIDPVCLAPTEVWVAIHVPGSDISASPTGAVSATSSGGSFAN